MSGKVSMVIPCYNKVEDIGYMFDSIIAQDWDYIELILVNDGSTDGTREVIAAYEPRFKARGYEVVIIDQENAGVCAAAVAGLRRVTGDYVCQVDADDELDPKYVSTMAGWLEENPEYDFAICDRIFYKGRGAAKLFEPFYPVDEKERTGAMLLKYLLADQCSTVYSYMLRKAYFDKCDIVNTYYIESKGSHEPGYIIPIFAYGGSYKFFPTPLYLFNFNGVGHSQFNGYSHAQGFYTEYDKLCGIAFDRLSESVLDAQIKAVYKRIATFAQLHKQYWAAWDFSGPAEQDAVASKLFTHITEWIDAIDPASMDIARSRIISLCWSLINGLLNEKRPSIPEFRSRIIGYGALGGAAKYLLPELEGSSFECTELWDISGDGRHVKRPAFNTLTHDDLLLILPKSRKVQDAVKKHAKPSACAVLTHWHTITALAIERFPEVYEACRKMRGVII